MDNDKAGSNFQTFESFGGTSVYSLEICPQITLFEEWFLNHFGLSFIFNDLGLQQESTGLILGEHPVWYIFSALLSGCDKAVWRSSAVQSTINVTQLIADFKRTHCSAK